jgi:group I intron endonuclease
LALIYLIRNLVNEKVYIGQHKGTNVQARLRRHVIEAKRGSRFVLHNAIRKYGASAFDAYALSTYASSQQDLDAQEIFYIGKYRATDRRFGYNILDGGSGFRNFRPWNKGKKFSKELRRKLSLAHKNQRPTAYQIQRAIEVNTGRKYSEETLQKMRKPKSEQTKIRMSAAQRRRTKHGMSGKSHRADTKKKMRASALAWRGRRGLLRKAPPCTVCGNPALEKFWRGKPHGWLTRCAEHTTEKKGLNWRNQ